MATRYPVQTNTVDGALIDETKIPSADEKAALVGTDGAPGAGNKFVTDTDSRNSDARAPTAHATSHEPGGGDAMEVDAAANVGSLRTLGTGATQAAAGDDARLSDNRAPTAHAADHVGGGSDAIAVAVAAGAAGLMSGADKSKLDGIASGAGVVSAATVRTALASPEKNASVQTTDATATVIKTIPIAGSKAVLIECRVTGLKSDLGTAAGYILHAVFRNNAGTVSQVGTDSIDFVREDDANWGGPQTVINGTDVEIKVVGLAATTIDWGADTYVTTM